MRWLETDQALLVLVLVLALALVTLWVVIGAAEQKRTPAEIHCYAGTETLVSEDGEYPVFELECDGDVRVLVLD